jgi:glutaredoxin-related protein
MKHFSLALARWSGAVLPAGLILAVGSHTASSAESCERLEALAVQYASVELTNAQKQLKRKMVVWYSVHCIRQAER